MLLNIFRVMWKRNVNENVSQKAWKIILLLENTRFLFSTIFLSADRRYKLKRIEKYFLITSTSITKQQTEKKSQFSISAQIGLRELFCIVADDEANIERTTKKLIRSLYKKEIQISAGCNNIKKNKELIFEWIRRIKIVAARVKHANLLLTARTVALMKL